MYLIGTSGFQFDDWKGPFYPDGLAQKDWLTYYARHFNCVEINASYYRLLPARTFASMAARTPESFKFTVKAYRTLTHELGEGNAADFTAFLDALQPLMEAGKFGCLLAQFPTAFHNTPGSRDYLAHLLDRFDEYPMVVEFRNREWLKEEVFAFLRERSIGWCSVDEPQFRVLMPPVAVATSPLGYVRFHGRNYGTWWKGDGKTRYDYRYSAEELQEWVPRLQQLAAQTEKVYVFMNNCFGGQAVQNAQELQQMLRDTTEL